MYMTRHCCSALCVLALTLAAGAQQQSRLAWPNTFTGQPDFDFTREEVIADFERRQTETGIAVQIGDTKQLFRKTLLDPLGIGSPVSSGSTTGKTAGRGPKRISANVSSFDATDFTQTITLSSATSSTQPNTDLSEFKNYLTELLTNSDALKDTPVSEQSVQRQMNNLALQSVVTAPVKYAIINNIRYAEGDRFALTVNYIPDIEIIEALLEQALPPQQSVPFSTYQELLTIRDEVLEEYKKDRQENPNKFMQRHQLYVTVESIASRQVVLNVDGVDYVLSLRIVL